MIITNPVFVRVVKEGQYYFPASKHYEGNNNVICDRCEKKNISCCIAIPDEDVDLCMKCVGEISDMVANEPPTELSHVCR